MTKSNLTNSNNEGLTRGIVADQLRAWESQGVNSRASVSIWHPSNPCRFPQGQGNEPKKEFLVSVLEAALALVEDEHHNRNEGSGRRIP